MSFEREPMLHTPDDPTGTKTVRGKDLEGKTQTLVKTLPQQLQLFQMFLPDDDERYSNTIELYDAIPKYFTNPRAMEGMRQDGKYLPELERSFRHRHETYRVTIYPARVKDQTGQVKEYYPGPREELVEDALRKIACEHMNGVYLNDKAGVQFTLYELKQELKAHGHQIHHNMLMMSLAICRRTTLHLSTEDGGVVLDSSIFPELLLATRKDWLESPKETRCYVQFNLLVTQCLHQLSYRQFDYGTAMTYTHRLSRWLHKRLAHNYTQAGLLHPYTIRLSTILRDSGTAMAARGHENSRRVEEVLTELQERHILLSVTAETMRGPRGRLHDITYTLLPTLEFIAEAKKANRRAAQLTHAQPVLMSQRPSSTGEVARCSPTRSC